MTNPTIAQKLRVACPWCRGRGWLVGECHPQETCGECNGTGFPPLDTTGDRDELREALATLRLPEGRS